MITLGQFTGLLIKDFLEARQQADAFSASISEDYHVNPFMKGMTVPHYTISEVEIDAPVQVVGICESEISKDIINRLISCIDKQLPTLLFREIKNAYYNKENMRVAKSGGEVEPERIGILPDKETSDIKVVHLSSVPSLKASYRASTADICVLMSQYMTTYLKESNLQTLKLLDFSDVFADTLYHTCKQDFSTYPEAETPFINKNALKNLCNIISNKMFFEFKKEFQQKEGLLINPITSKMTVHDSSQNILHIKLKLREQDLDIIVDEDTETGTKKRFLSLS